MITAAMLMHVVDHRDGFIAVWEEEMIVETIFFSVVNDAYRHEFKRGFAMEKEHLTSIKAEILIQRWLDHDEKLTVSFDHDPRQQVDLQELAEAL